MKTWRTESRRRSHRSITPPQVVRGLDASVARPQADRHGAEQSALVDAVSGFVDLVRFRRASSCSGAGSDLDQRLRVRVDDVARLEAGKLGVGEIAQISVRDGRRRSDVLKEAGAKYEVKSVRCRGALCITNEATRKQMSLLSHLAVDVLLRKEHRCNELNDGPRHSQKPERRR
jgi:hypothetical protein